MIQFRLYSSTDEAGEFIDFSKHLTEIVTDDGIWRFMGKRGLMLELMHEMDIFRSENATVDGLSYSLQEGDVEIYMQDWSDDHRKYTVVLTARDLCTLFDLQHEEKLMLRAMRWVYDFLKDGIQNDNLKERVYEPVDFAILCVTGCVVFMNEDKFNKKFNEDAIYTIYEFVNSSLYDEGVDVPLADRKTAYDYIYKTMEGVYLT